MYIECGMLRFLERKENEKGSIYLQKVVERYILPLYLGITSDANNSLLGCKKQLIPMQQ